MVPSDVKAAFHREMAEANSAELEGDLALAKCHQERAHILGQRWLLAHLASHFHMLRIAIKEANSTEARGQIVRRIGATPFHIIGWLPVGNTGGADVSPTLPMQIPSDLQPYFSGCSLRNGLALRGMLAVLILAFYWLSPVGWW